MLCRDPAHCVVAARFCHPFDAASLQVLGQAKMYATYLCNMHHLGPLSPQTKLESWQVLACSAPENLLPLIASPIL